MIKRRVLTSQIRFKVGFHIAVISLIILYCGLSVSHGGPLPFADDFNQENGGAGSFIDYHGFLHWDVTSGSVDVIINGHGGTLFGDGMFVDTVGIGSNGKITTKSPCTFNPGTVYRLTFDASGNQRASASDTITVTVGNGSILQEVFSLSWNAPWQTFAVDFSVSTSTNATISFTGTGSKSNQGMMLDNINLSVAPNSGLPVRVRLDNAIYYPVSTVTNRTYLFYGKDSPFANDWIELDETRIGTGDILYSFERGDGPPFLPSRAWEIRERTDDTSLSFDGVDDFAFHLHEPLLDLSTGMTIEAWIKPANPSSSTDSIILAKAVSPAITTYRMGTDGSDKAVFKVFDSTGTAFVDLTSSEATTLGVWSHVAATFDGSNACLYLNGSSNASTTSVGAVRSSTLAPLVVGSILGTDPFGGLIDELRLWDHARNPVEISNWHDAKLTGNEPGLVAYWQVRESGTQTALDSTANSLDLGLGETGGSDHTDPNWATESFPGHATFDEILEFGASWFAVVWNSEANATYTLESATSDSPDFWSSVLEDIQGTGGEIEFFESPPLGNPAFPSSRYYRVIGPPISNVTLGLIAHIPFDGNADDQTGNGHHGIPQGGVTFVNDGTRGQVAEFDGVNGVIDFGDVDAFELLDGSMSFSVWVKTAVSGSGGMHFLSMMKEQAQYDGYRFFIRDNSTCSPGALDFSANYNLSVGDQLTVAASTQVNDGTWHHVCGIIDRGAETIRLYVDGANDIGETGCGWFPISDSNGYGSSDSGTTPFLIGNRYQSTTYWHGRIDDVRIYDRALTLLEVHTLLNM